MAMPMTAAQVKTQLTKWGLKPVEIPGWSTHNRNAVGAWGGVNGFIWHHTGATISAASAKTYAAGTLYQGRQDLPGPLCHFSIGADGTLFLVGWGRANHAGGGDPTVLQHVINEDYSGQLHPTKGNSNGVDGNAHFYGVEIQYSGSHAMADAQYKTALRLSAALLDFHGWSEKSVIAHGEWSNDKWDPGYAPSRIMNMPDVRADVKAALAAGPNQEDDMAITDADATKIARAVLTSDGLIPNPYAGTADTNPEISLATSVRNIEIVSRRAEAKLDAQSAAIASLAGLIGSGVDTATVVAEVKRAIADAVVKVDVDITGTEVKES